MWKEVPRTRKKEVLSSHHVESSRPSLTTVHQRESGTRGADHVKCVCSHSEYTERNNTVFIISILYTVYSIMTISKS